MLSDELHSLLLDVARNSIKHGLEHGKPLTVSPPDYHESLQTTAATFVTLTIHGQLRGCIGALTATQPLVVDVAEHAFAAAFRDPRFPPLSQQEYPQLECHISILQPAEEINCPTEEELIENLEAGKDGLILKDRFHQATFLPSVWSSLPDKRAFVTNLKLKAGLSADYWSDEMQCYRYRVEEFSDSH